MELENSGTVNVITGEINGNYITFPCVIIK